MEATETPDSHRMFDYYRELEASDITLTFKGAMSQHTLVELGDVLRLPETDRDCDDTSTVKKLFAIMVEMAQNILLYSSQRRFLPAQNREVGVGMLVLMQNDHRYVLSCSNRLARSEAARIEERCQHINRLSPEELRQLYRQERRKPRSDDQGAGLGLIDIARRAGSPLQYAFHEIGEGEYFFTLSVAVAKVTKPSR